ncbi:MAG: ABC transporter substrate-binding protein [Thermodesulfovibrionales bacterium]|jgi:phospholipid transport system substrate-binding protein
MFRHRSLAILLLSLVIGGVLVMEARAGVPTNQVKQSVDRVLEIVRSKELKQPSRLAERRAAIRKVVAERFDFEEMARRAMALHWAKRTAEEKQEFIPLFTDLLERSYIKKIESYEDEQILYIGEQLDNPNAVVKSKVITKRRVEIPLDYRLINEKGSWRVYDVVIEGVSLVNNYRTQFNKIITRESYEALVKKMRSKEAELSFEEKK